MLEASSPPLELATVQDAALTAAEAIKRARLIEMKKYILFYCQKTDKRTKGEASVVL